MSEQQIVLGGGCFWCLDAAFSSLRGVTGVTSGYAGGEVANPTYEQVCSGTTGHAEVVQIQFDPDQISKAQLLEVFMSLHDPTTLNRQGGDVGTQYRSVIFTTSPEDEAAAAAAIASATPHWDNPIVTEIAPLSKFWAGEEYHQDYFANNPDQGYCAAVISPKISKLRSNWAHLLT